MNNNECKYLPIRDAVKLTGLCAQTLRKLCDEKKLDFYKTESGQRKFSKTSLEKLCNNTIIQSGNNSPIDKIFKKSIEKKKYNIFYFNNKTTDLDNKIQNRKQGENDIIICEENGIYKIIDYCLNKNNYINIIITDNDYKINFNDEYNILKYIIEKTDNNIIEL